MAGGGGGGAGGGGGGRGRGRVPPPLEAMTQRVLNERLIPLVNARFPAACRGLCTPCYSLIRRYGACRAPSDPVTPYPSACFQPP